MNGVKVEWQPVNMNFGDYISHNLSKDIVTACTYRYGVLWAASEDCVFLGIL